MASSYSYKSIVGSFSDPDVGVYIFSGQEGIKHLSISNANDRTTHDVAADGAVMVSYTSGSNASVEIECQQNSSLHTFLVLWANIKFTNAENGNAANFAGAAMKVVDLLSSASHILTGISPLKIPDKPYGPTGSSVTWRLMAANAVQQ